MKILVVDRDRLSTQMVRSRLESKGHQVFEESVKNDALEKLSKETYDCVFIDPAPLNNPRPVILGIRRTVSNYPYIVLMSHSNSREEAIAAGTNDVLNKPLDVEDLDKKLVNGQRLVSLVKRIGDESEDFPSAGGVIAKSAFNQLFLSAIDRADRYGERSYVVFISLSNYGQILDQDGPYAADYAVAKMSQYLVKLRRQSDIIAQTAKYEYALLLQRPQYETEPIEAANRFAESLSQYDDIVSTGSTDVEMTVSLIDVPVGAEHIKHVIGAPANGSEEVSPVETKQGE